MDTTPTLERTTVAGPGAEPVVTLPPKPFRVDPALAVEVQRREQGLPPSGSGYRLPERSNDPAPLSPAMRRLQRLREEAAALRQGLPVPNRIEARAYNGETWYFLRLDYAGLAEVRLRAAQAIGEGFKPYWRAIARAELLNCVAKGSNDATPYFSEADIDAWLNEPAGSEIYELIDWLIGNALELNPIQKKVTTTTSSPSAPENTATASAATPSGGDASTSQENSAAAT